MRQDGYDDQYDHMNAGAHRRPAPQITAPALTWHRGYWRPTESYAEGAPVKPFDWESLDDWKDKIDRTLLELFNHFYKLALNDRTEDVHPKTRLPRYFVSSNLEGQTLYLFSNKWDFSDAGQNRLIALSSDERSVRHDIFSLRTQIDGIGLVISARRHLEYFSITFAGEFAATGDTHWGSAAVRSINRHFGQLHDIAAQRYRKFEDSPTIATAPDEHDEIFEASNDNLIGKFKSWVNEQCATAFAQNYQFGQLDHSETKGFGRCGAIYSDFFGVIFSLSLNAEGNQLEFVGPLPLDPGQAVTIPAQVQGRRFDEDCATRVADAVWPIARAFSRFREIEARHGKSEYTVTLFEDERAMYISSLGRILPDVAMHGHEPVIYTLIASYRSKWRLGRLIDRLHTLGTLRLAALRDLSAINDSSNRINRAFSLLGGFKREESTAENMKAVYAEVDHIGEYVDVGLTTRVERSRYFVSSYKDLLRMMKPGRVQGFQTYAEFARSRIFDAFDFIDRVGRRYNDLLRAISFRLEVTHRNTLIRLQDTTAEQTKVTARQTEATKDLLKTAEILSIIPIAYYSGSILYGSSVGIRAEHPDMSWLPKSEWVYFVIGLVPGTFVAAFARLRRLARAIRVSARTIVSRN